MEPCPVCALNELLYPLECSHKLCLKCLKGACVHTSACPSCQFVFSSTFKTRVVNAPGDIRDVGVDIDARIEALLAAGNAWAYNDRKNKGCWLYDEHTQGEIKNAKDSGLTVLESKACGYHVRIDLHRLKQINPVTHATRRIRHISADTVAIKGIAGMPRTVGAVNNNNTPLTKKRDVSEPLTSYRARIRADFYVAGMPGQRADEKKVAFNRRVKAWADNGC